MLIAHLLIVFLNRFSHRYWVIFNPSYF